jgi:hypothetical protein
MKKENPTCLWCTKEMEVLYSKRFCTDSCQTKYVTHVQFWSGVLQAKTGKGVILNKKGTTAKIDGYALVDYSGELPLSKGSKNILSLVVSITDDAKYIPIIFDLRLVRVPPDLWCVVHPTVLITRF